MLYEGVVTTPRDLDQDARCSVPGACPRSGWPARLAELTAFCVCIVGIAAPGKGTGDNQIIQLLHVCSFERLGQIYTSCVLRCILSLMRNTRRSARVTPLPAILTRLPVREATMRDNCGYEIVERMPSSTAASGGGLDYADVECFGPKTNR